MTLEKIILRFDRSRPILKLIKEVFNEIAGSEGALDLNGLLKAMGKLHGDMSAEDVKGLFEFVDIDESMKIELKEFLVALVIGHVLDIIPSKPAQSDENRNIDQSESLASVNVLQMRKDEITTMMKLIVNAHLLFDPTASGVIHRSDVERILMDENSESSGSTLKKKKNPLLHDERWKQMDWNSDGSIDFAEFVFAFCSWVDIDDDMD
jgi:calcium-binding protein CML